MQRDYWYSSMRDARELAALEAVGRHAAERALSRLGHRRLSTRQCPVLLESPSAAGLLGHFVQGVSGGALYRRTTFAGLAGQAGVSRYRHRRRPLCAARQGLFTL